jgi:hypothetical protein
VPARLTRIVVATALALSWVVAAALPGAAEVTGWGVQTPSAGAVLDRAADLVVYVDRTPSPEDEEVFVRTRMLDGEGEPVSDKVRELKFKRAEPREAGGDQLLFGGTIDPLALEWLPEVGVAANGPYTLQLQVHVINGEVQRTTDWNDHPLTFDAPPPSPGQAQIEVVDAAAKRMRISWEPSTAPDLLHYTVERRVDGGPWQVAEDLVAPDRTVISDTVATYGSYRYRVTAVRPSGSDPAEYRATTGDASSTTELAPPRKPAQRGSGAAAGQQDGDTQDGAPPPPPRVRAPAPPVQRPQFDVPTNPNTTFEGPLDYGVKPKKVTERVPIEVARGGTSEEGGVLTVLSRNIDQQRVLPAIAGGLIFLLSAAHVLRYLNE